MLQRALTMPDSQIPSAIGRPLLAMLQSSSDTVRWLIAMMLGATIEVALPIVMSLFALFVLLLRKIHSTDTDVGMRATVRPIEWLICIPPLIGFTVWVIVSPEPRYIASSLWLLAAALLSMMLRNTRRSALFIAAIAALSILPIGYRMVALKFNPASGPVRQAIFIPAGPDRGFHPIPVVPLVKIGLTNGLVVHIPREPGTAWDAPLPATASLNSQLTLRVPFDLRSGFKVDPNAKVEPKIVP